MATEHPTTPPVASSSAQHRLVQAWAHRGLLAWVLWPVSLLYGLVVAVRRWLFKEGISETWRLPARVMVVGNVVAGGAGKTPVVMALVKHLQARGLKVGVVSRGYGRIEKDCREVLPGSTAVEVGDEPALIRRATGAAVFVATQRVDAAKALLAKYPEIQVIVSDDGLQHYALQRDLEICVFDDRGIGNGFLLPAGPLREPWPRDSHPREPWPRRALQSKTTQASTGGLLWPTVDTLVLHTGAKPAFASGLRAERTLASHAVRRDGSTLGLADLRGQPVAAVAAIAQPTAFFDMLRAQGLTLAHTQALPDHYKFDSWSRPFDGGHPLICTEKDAVKLWQTHPEALAVPLLLTPEAAFWAAVDAALLSWGLGSAAPSSE